MKRLLVAAVVALIPSRALAQAPGSSSPPSVQSPSAASEASLATPAGHEIDFSLAHYDYVEPGELRISIHGAKVGGEYMGTLLLNRRQHWFFQANALGTIGSVTYDGWCSPWLIAPNSDSPNGYELDIGDASGCSESGDRDGYVEARALVGKDFLGQTLAFSPRTGLGVRHLSNGTTGVAGYRTDTYLYLPLGVEARTRVASRSLLGFNLEYDRLLHGWQKTRDSELGGGDVPATTTTPAFTIDGFSDLSFAQSSGWAVRASATYRAANGWSVEPYYLRWSVGASPLSYETATFTVNNITAQEQLGAYEPTNTTNEFGVKLGFRF